MRAPAGLKSALLKADFSAYRAVALLEAQYRRHGLTRWEMSDLDRRYDRLSARVRIERADNNRRPGGRW